MEHTSVCEQTTSELIKSVRPINMKRGGVGEERKIDNVQQQQQKEKVGLKEDSHGGIYLPQTGCLGLFNPERKEQLNNTAPDKNRVEERMDCVRTDKINVPGNGAVNIETKRFVDRSQESNVSVASNSEGLREERNHNNATQELNTQDESRDEDISTPETVINKSSSRVGGDADGGELNSQSEPEETSQDVLEWARKKKRKVQTHLNRDDEKQRTMIRQQQSINCTNDIMKVTNGGGGEGGVGGVNASSTSSATNGSWSVTVAGCYHPNMAPPDLQMRLSFPGARKANDVASSGTLNWSEPSVPKLPRHPSLAYEDANVPALDLHQVVGVDEEEDEEEDNDAERHEEEDLTIRQVLPVIDVVPRKSLMRVPLDDCKVILDAC